MCKQCGEDTDLKTHCQGFTCGWVVCHHCGCTTDAASANPEAFFAKKGRTPGS